MCAVTAPSESKKLVATDQLKALKWRSIGPFRGGRVVAVAADPVDDQVFYFGSTGGGVWKTYDGGQYWENVSDGFFKRASVGALAVSVADPNVIYAGMGETSIRGNVSHGDGVYKSTDAGKTWQHLGLEETRNIAKVRIHPKNPDLVYVAALGHAHGPNSERGVYRSKDGGQTWEKILYRNENAGAIDLAMDPNNPRVLYAAFWEARRNAYSLTSGGEGSGIFKSTDGGDTWTEITRNEGLPKGILGKIGIVASPAKRDRVWAIVEAEDGAVFRSDDGGETWERLSEDRNLRQRAWYYHHIYADPQDPETVWVLNVESWKSTDGGKTFFTVPNPHGDNHDLWIDPQNPMRMINGNDGGATVTFNGGESWTTIYNQPTSEFYHVATDNQVPYRVYGAQQDNTTITVPSRSSIAGITRSEAFDIGGGESGYIAVHPENHNIVYAGSYGGLLTRYDHSIGQKRNIMVWPEVALGQPAVELKYRFQWTYPILISPHDPNVLFVTSQHVHRSTDEGSSWEVISPDLTRNDPETQGPSGGPITKDNTGAETYGTIFAFAESKLQQGLFWAGSDDGLIHVSKDGGANWENVTPPDLPVWALISIIEPSPHDPGTAYVAATRYKLDDFSPYLYKTTDYGKTWEKITDGIPNGEFTRVIREDPNRKGLLYAGTEAGMYVSFDDGASWGSLQLNLPVVPIHDLEIKGTDLVAATHGRAFWILDDLTPLHQLEVENDEATAKLYQPRTTVKFMTNRGFGHDPAPGKKNYQMSGATMLTYRVKKNQDGEQERELLDAGENPPDGVQVFYWLKEKPEGEIKLTFSNAQGNEIRSFTSKPDEQDEDNEQPTVAGESLEAPAQQAGTPEGKKPDDDAPKAPKEPGLNRFVWNMRLPDASKVEGDASMRFVGGITGPMVPPGSYKVRLEVAGQSFEESFDIEADPRVSASQEDLQAQFELLKQIQSKLSETNETITGIRKLRGQIEDWAERTEDEKIREAVKSLKEKLTAIEEELIQTKAKSSQDTLNFPIKLNAKLAGLASVVASADAAPTKQSHEVYEYLSGRIDEQIAAYRGVVETNVPAFNNLVREANVPAIEA